MVVFAPFSVAMYSAAYADSSSGSRATTSGIYTVHVDSRNRDARSTTTPASYSVALGKELRNVRTIQVGDVQLPVEARAPFNASCRHFGVSEPLVLRTNTTLAVTETTHVYSVSTGELLSTTPGTSVTATFPATLNPVASVTSATVDFVNDHGLESVLMYWPRAAPTRGPPRSPGTWSARRGARGRR